jgi:glycosyltransferase involved in cell wall biosynthesis
VSENQVRRVCIDARLVRGVSGGVEQAVIGLAHGLAQLNDGSEEYLFLTYRDEVAWLRPYLGGACAILPGPPAPRRAPLPGPLKSVRRLFRAAYHRWSPLLGPRTVTIPHSDGTAEQSGAALLHFTSQRAFVTQLPSIYQPWDLQHLHLPHFFTPRERLAREVSYRLFCRRADFVAVASTWVARDLVRQYGLPEAKVKVVPAAPPVSVYRQPTAADLQRTREKYNLAERFIFYPAQTWPHKNHLGLLQALAMLRDQAGLTVPLVCSGTIFEPHFPRIERRLRQLKLETQVSFLGYVDELVLHSLYRLCRFMVYPTYFEGLGLPLLEAFQAGVPVACAAVTSLPETAGDAALMFDPADQSAIAAAIRRLWTEPDLGVRLSRQGRLRAAGFSWENTARTFRAHYRRLAGWPLTNEDQALLALCSQDSLENRRTPRRIRNG